MTSSSSGSACARLREGRRAAGTSARVVPIDERSSVVHAWLVQASLDPDKLARALGPAFRSLRSGKGRKARIEVEHLRSKTLFVAIPGGTLDMGETHEEYLALSKLELQENVTREQVEAMKNAKTKKTKIAPFLCARAPVHGALARQVLGKVGWAIDEREPEASVVRLSRAAATTLAKAFAKDGLRLLTGPEWEWVAREGSARSTFINGRNAKVAEAACAALYKKPRFDPADGPPATNGFGVWGLPWGEFVADPKGTRRTPACCRGGAAMLYHWQADEIVMCVPSFGYRLGKSKESASVRFAIDMPS